MTKKIVCMYHIFKLKDCGPGLKDSGIGDCCKCFPSQDNKACKLYNEICLDEDNDPAD